MTMRDALFTRLHNLMAGDERIFIVSDDFGAPTLDKIRADYPGRFVNVGIAEQNAANIVAGLAMEGFAPFGYGIAGFMTMRCYEQLRTNLAMAAQIRPLNANIVGVGAGISYDLSGPSHHCLEDLTLMRLLPNFEVFSPADGVTTTAIADYAVRSQHPKYIRLDSKPLPAIYDAPPRIADGFHEFKRGRNVCLVTTGYMTHVALRAAAESDLGVVDVFSFPPLDEARLLHTLKPYRHVITIEEGFIRKGGFDALILGLVARAGLATRVHELGFDGRYLYEVGQRAQLHALCGMDEAGILALARKVSA
jgi:transketolase